MNIVILQYIRIIFMKYLKQSFYQTVGRVGRVVFKFDYENYDPLYERLYNAKLFVSFTCLYYVMY